MILYTHPDNVKFVTELLNKPLQAINQHQYSGALMAVRIALGNSLNDSVRICTNSAIPRERCTGRYVLKNGEYVATHGDPFMKFSIKERFITYTQDDLQWLLYVGLVRKETEPLVYRMKDNAVDSMFRSIASLSTLSWPPSIIKTGVY